MADAATTTTLPEYLPYNAYKNLENMNQKPQEDIHPLQSHVQNEDKQSLKQQEQSQSEIRHHNHHHHRQHPNAALPEIPEVELKPETQSTEVLTTTQVPTTSTSATTVSSSTAAPAIIEESTFSELKKKLEEKALRRERLKAKLAQLTPEERQAFLLMKQQRAEARKKGLSFATSS
ncbi:hypothetical protein PVAND_008173 [Polypedilum vanderplanki]|uniref:Uncharacterized protein n=1 Tax=Polypedilum vanderplanki TaxID=319348 RepID=A0A9J6C8Y7_POLVA|nr:hypothetical protein PVAND_008173 [Polypedilum vanderplanki]